MIDINLLPSQAVVSQKESEFRAKFILAIWICSLVLAVDLAVFFVVQQWDRRQVSGLLAKRVELTLASEQLSTVALDLRTVQEKTHGFGVVFSMRPNFVPTIFEVRSLVGSQVEMSDLSLTTSSVRFTASAPNVGTLNDFVSRAALAGGTLTLRNIVLESLRLGSNGGFNFQVEANYQSK